MERSRPAEAGQRIIGQFFFVHAPEAQTLAGRQVQGGQPQRAYEFLHATFGEYLVARRVMDELVDVTARAFSGRRGPTEPDDDLLFALLSHQVLAARKSMLGFAREIFADLDGTVGLQVLRTLEIMVRTYRNRHGSDRYAAYRPVLPDQVRQLACYSANLVVLRLVLESSSSGVPLAELLGVSGPFQEALDEWRATPLLWNSSLDPDSLGAMFTALELTGLPPRLYVSTRNQNSITFEIALARLIGDEVTEKILRYGTAICSGATYYLEDSSWADMMSSMLIPAIAGISRISASLPTPPKEASKNDIAKIAELIFKYLRSSSYDEYGYIRVLQLLFNMPTVFKMDELALTAAAIGHKSLREAVPELQNFEVYGHYAAVVRRADGKPSQFTERLLSWKDPSRHVVYTVEDVLRKK